MNKKTVTIVAVCLLLIVVAISGVKIKTSEARIIDTKSCDMTWSEIKTCYSPTPHPCCEHRFKEEIEQPN
ncbi:hypothetical protein KKI23_03665 [Patescibacteria group bacterium]|nr:hypothetical protein [Patescibacteria group bacterium]